MKFELNGIEWTIEEIDEERMKAEAELDHIWGLTVYSKQKVFLLDSLSKELLIQTLKHELTHAWLDSYAHPQNNEYKYHYEQICEIVAKSNDFINDIVEKYKEAKNEKKSVKRTRKNLHT